jgi:hypothetical protein
VIGSLPRYAHIARTDASPIRGVLDLVPDDAAIPGMSDLRFHALADVIPGMRQVRQDTANAVGCNHPPGFKSPILRSSQALSRNSQGWGLPYEAAEGCSWTHS